MDTSLQIGPVTLPTALVILSTIIFLVLERAFPGRQLPHSKGWYLRAIIVNLAQMLITLATARIWIDVFGDLSLFKLSNWKMPLLDGFVGWFVGTFFFYWWHRLRHALPGRHCILADWNVMKVRDSLTSV